MGAHYNREFYEAIEVEKKHIFTSKITTDDGILKKGEEYDCFGGLVSGVSGDCKTTGALINYSFEDTSVFKYTPKEVEKTVIKCRLV